MPYRARLGTGITPWTDGPSFFAGNCLARASTNGVDYYANTASRISLPEPGREKYFAAPVAPQDRFRTQNSESGSELLFDVDLPPPLLPGTPTGGSGAMQFYQLDNTTGVLALGSFSGTYSTLQSGLLSGLLNLKSRGLTKLVVDVTNNGGGYVCIAHWLHRLLAGANPKSEPIAGLYTTLRATPVARAIVDRISNDHADPSNFLLYNALGWRDANHTDFPEFYNWLTPGVPRVVNGRDDPFGDTCVSLRDLKVHPADELIGLATNASRSSWMLRLSRFSTRRTLSLSTTAAAPRLVRSLRYADSTSTVQTEL